MNIINDISLVGIVGDVNTNFSGLPLQNVVASVEMKMDNEFNDLVHCFVSVINENKDMLYEIELSYKLSFNEHDLNLEQIKELLPPILQKKIENAIAFIGIESGQSKD